MTQSEKAAAFAALHRPGDPVVLYNIWDAGSAKAIAEAGAKAVATGSWSVAAAQGYGDGQRLPLELLLQIVAQIVRSVAVPVSVDFEGGYATTPDLLADNIKGLLATGAVGLNFEDQVVGGAGLYDADAQAARIAIIRQVADAAAVPLFINARTDLFLREADTSKHAALLPEALARGALYQQAGASGFFVPGLTDPALLAEVCRVGALPVNAMRLGAAPDRLALAKLGIARVSYGPGPYREAMANLKERFAAL